MPIIAYYKFDGNGNDSSGNGKHLTDVNNNITYDTSTKKFGSSSITFTNLTDYFEIANDGYFSPYIFSISVWVRAYSHTEYQAIASCRYQDESANSRAGWMLYISTGNALEFWTGNDTVWQNNLIKSNFVNSSTTSWQHVVVTVSRTSSNSTASFTAYVDNTLEATWSDTYDVNNQTNFRVGAGRNEDSPFYVLDDTPGSWVDDLRIYDTVLTSSDVSDIYNNVPICYHKNTLLNTDQGICKIMDLTNKHTIDNSKIVFLFKSDNCPNQLVLIKKDAFQINKPSNDIYCTKNHVIEIDNIIQQAHKLVNNKSILLVDNLDDVYNLIINNKKFINVSNINMGVIDISDYQLTNLNNYIKNINNNKNEKENDNKKIFKFRLIDDSNNQISNLINLDIEKYKKFNNIN